MRSLSGRNLGAYRLIEQVGLGGMAVIYKAYDPALDRYVAIKLLPEYLGHAEEFSARFRNEARNVARLSHPNILPIYGYGEEDGLSYFVMGLVEGGTLKDLMGQPMEPERAASLIVQLAGALQYAHEQGIVHRDVKPANVLMSRPDWPLLSDFGIARVLEQQAALTRSAFLGTPHYMAPEQARGETVTPKTDQYALGIVLYEMLTGAPPFQADTPQAVVYQHIYSSLPLPHERNPNISEAMERVILKSLAKDPPDRFPDMAAFAAAAREAVGGTFAIPSRTPPPGLAPPAQPEVGAPFMGAPFLSEQTSPAPSSAAPSSASLRSAHDESAPTIPGPSTERIERTAVTPAVVPVEPPPPTEATQADRGPPPRPVNWRKPALGVGGLAVVAVVVFAALHFAGSGGSGLAPVTVLGPSSAALPAITVQDVTSDSAIATVTPKGATAQVSLKPGRYTLQFPSGSAYRMPVPFTVKGDALTIRLADRLAFVQVKVPSGSPPPITVRSPDGTDVADLTPDDARNGVWLLDGRYLLDFASGSGYNGKLRVILSGQNTIHLAARMAFVRVVAAPGTTLTGAEMDDAGGAYRFSIGSDVGTKVQAIPPGRYRMNLGNATGYFGSLPFGARRGSHIVLYLARLYAGLTIVPARGAPLPDITVNDARTGAYGYGIPATQALQGVYMLPGRYSLDLSGSDNVYLDAAHVTLRRGAHATLDLSHTFGRLSVAPFPQAATPAFDIRDPSGNTTIHSVTATQALQDHYLRPGSYSLLFNDSNSYFAPVSVTIHAQTSTTLNLGRVFGELHVVSAPGAPVSSFDIHAAAGSTLPTDSTVSQPVFLPPGRYSLVFSSVSNAYLDPLAITVKAGVSQRIDLKAGYAAVLIPGVPSTQSVSYAWRSQSANTLQTVNAQTKAQVGYLRPGAYRVEITNGSANRILVVRAVAGKTVKLPAH